MKKKRKLPPIARNIAKFRRQRGWTQKELSRHSGVGVANIRRYETAAVLPALDAMVKLASTLGVTTDSLVFEEGNGVAQQHVADPDLLKLFGEIQQLGAPARQATKLLLESLVVRAKIEGMISTLGQSGEAEPESKTVALHVSMLVDRIVESVKTPDRRMGPKSG